MIWSLSKARIFQLCPRKWYYYDVVASHRSKDPLRHETYLLKQLQTVSAWRGSLIDKVIGNSIIPAIRRRNPISETEIINYAMQLFDKQIAFGKCMTYRATDAAKSSLAYSALYEVEYGGGLDDTQISRAREEVTCALQNIIRSGYLEETARHSSLIAVQRRLAFRIEGLKVAHVKRIRTRTLDAFFSERATPDFPNFGFEEIKVSCTPDLIALYANEPPLITDWKAHSFANTDARLQLGLYAFALSKVKPHRDFPQSSRPQLADPTRMRLVEYQLIQNQQRVYTVTSDDIAEFEDYIFESNTRMNQLLELEHDGGFEISQIPVASSPNACSKCQFRRLCWEAK